MLEKTMKQIITKKIDKWLETITDETVVKVIKEDLIITGGCFTSFIQNEEPKDYDCYFRNKETVLKVAEYYVNIWNENHKNQQNKLGVTTKVFVLEGGKPTKDFLKYYQIDNLQESASRMIANTPDDRIKIIFPSDGIVGDPKAVGANEELGTVIENIEEIDEVKADEILEKERTSYFPVFMSTNAITLSNGIQLIVRFYGEPDEIHETYDYEHTKAYYDIKDEQIIIPKIVYEMVVNKTLRYTGSRYPVASLFRLRKFINRGWRINAGQILKIAMQVSDLDLMDIDVLEDQLVGVDSVYFMNLIEQFRKQKENDSNFVLTTGYLLTVVDKIF